VRHPTTSTKGESSKIEVAAGDVEGLGELEMKMLTIDTAIILRQGLMKKHVKLAATRPNGWR